MCWGDVCWLSGYTPKQEIQTKINAGDARHTEASNSNQHRSDDRLKGRRDKNRRKVMEQDGDDHRRKEDQEDHG